MVFFQGLASPGAGMRISTMAKRIATHSRDAKIGYTTHDKFGEPMKLFHVINGEDAGLLLPFTDKGIAIARKIVADDGGHFADNFGNIWVE